MNNLIDSLLSMKLDVYRQIDSQDTNTGAIKRMDFIKQWIAMQRVISNSATSRGSDRQVFSNRYSNEQILQIRTLDRLTARDKITNIRDSSNRPIWTEINYPNETPTVLKL